MAEALIKGLLACRLPAKDIWVADPNPKRQDLMREVYSVEVTADNLAVVRACHTIVLAIKPQLVDEVVPGLAEEFTGEHQLISILAGTATHRLENLLGAGARVIRAMPNTPALVGAGVAALSGGANTTADDLDKACKLLGAVGETCVVEEDLMDAVTGLSGSGPAYVFSMIEALVEGGVRQGLAKQVATELAVQTVQGAARLVAETGDDPAELRARVCSPGGTTMAGLTALEEGGFNDILIEAVERATRRSKELAKD